VTFAPMTKDGLSIEVESQDVFEISTADGAIRIDREKLLWLATVAAPTALYVAAVKGGRR
jgi:hypothetical protein